MNETLRTSMKWLIFIITPFALIMIVFGENLLELFYGGIYVNGVIVLLLFVIALVIRSIFSLPQLTLAAMRMLAVEMKAVGVAAISNIILNFLFIPLWGINGAAFASLISFILLSLMVFYYSKKLYKFSFPKETYKPLIAGLIALVVILLLKGPLTLLIGDLSPIIQNMFFQYELLGEVAEKLVKFLIFGLLFLLSVVIYFIALLILRSFGNEELDILSAALRKARIPEQYISFIRKFLEGEWLKLPV